MTAPPLRLAPDRTGLGPYSWDACLPPEGGRFRYHRTRATFAKGKRVYRIRCDRCGMVWSRGDRDRKSPRYGHWWLIYDSEFGPVTSDLFDKVQDRIRETWNQRAHPVGVLR